jgi:hypothetical protein
MGRLRSPTVIALAAGLAAAVALRVYAIVSFRPAVLNNNVHDGAVYMRAARRALGSGAQEPSGYPLFLRVVHGLSDDLMTTIGVQHALGLAAGMLLFFVVRRLDAPAWLGLFPAAIVWFNGDQLFLEHALLTEAVFTLVLVATVYAALRCLEGNGSHWALIAGGMGATLLTIRSVALPVPFVVIGWLALASWRLNLRWRRNVAVAAAAALMVTAAYGVVRHNATGRWSVLPEGSQWILYARAAEFADCRKFTPPPGTKVLCESTPPSKRPGPGFYLYLGGPARAAFGGPEFHGDRVIAFARAAITHQPLDYLELVWTDAIRYVAPKAGPRRNHDFGEPGRLAFPAGTPSVDSAVEREAAAYYRPFKRPSGSPAHGLSQYQKVFRVNGVVLLAFLVLGVAGAASSGTRLRWGIGLLLAIGLELVLVPPLTHAEWRYAVPAEGLAAAAAAAGAWAVARRRGGSA